MQLILNTAALIPCFQSLGVTWVLVVSNINLTKNLSVMKPATFLESSIKDFVLNLNNDYRYLKTGYYVSMHAEVLGNSVIPTSKNIIDANRTPILLLKASKAGIPTLPYIVTDSVKKVMTEFDFPVVVFAVNPFTYDGFQTAKNKSALYRAVKSLGMHYKFAVCAQPLKGKMISFKSIFGKCEQEQNLREISEKVYEVFRIPLCKLHTQSVGKEAFLCGLQPLRKDEVLPCDLKRISEQVSQISDVGDHLVG
ncbi:RimK-like ATPgrasp N-terminal domain-containing protein [Candidatus Bathyarchaeota archaeon]|nr:RimK-like ATPgrasp N-terminal domain-containing protein [Candidatus Bathyarchaeota archaeon]